jgi:hypothetical protein
VLFRCVQEAPESEETQIPEVAPATIFVPSSVIEIDLQSAVGELDNSTGEIVAA